MCCFYNFRNYNNIMYSVHTQIQQTVPWDPYHYASVISRFVDEGVFLTINSCLNVTDQLPFFGPLEHLLLPSLTHERVSVGLCCGVDWWTLALPSRGRHPVHSQHSPRCPSPNICLRCQPAYPRGKIRVSLAILMYQEQNGLGKGSSSPAALWRSFPTDWC